MVIYKVQPGDTLGKIAKAFYGDAGRFPLIVAANDIADPDRLAVGRSLVIPDLAVASAAVKPPRPTPLGPAAPGGEVANPTARLNDQRLNQVHPVFAARGRSMIDLCARAGIAVLVTQRLRTWEEQDALHAKGRTVPPIGKKPDSSQD